MKRQIREIRDVRGLNTEHRALQCGPLLFEKGQIPVRIIEYQCSELRNIILRILQPRSLELIPQTSLILNDGEGGFNVMIIVLKLAIP